MKSSKTAHDFTPLIPQGVQCYFGEEVSRRRKVESILAGIMRCWGFEEIILPFFDYLESFSYGLGPELGEKAYRFLDRDGSLLALRPDLTPLVAKTVATRMTEHPVPIKLFYSGEVFRQEKPGAGRQREFYQIGLESIGGSGISPDIEMILIAMDCLLHLGVTDFKLVLGHVGFFNGIVEGLALPPEKAASLRDAIDHKDCARLRREVADLAVSADKKKFLEDLPNFSGGREVLDEALTIVQNPRSRKALSELAEIGSVLRTLGLESRLALDLAEVRGLDYYTGIVFKLYGRPPGYELGGGGRYDGLLSRFGWDLPAVGFSLTLDRVLPLVADVAALAVPSLETEERILAPGCRPAEDFFLEVWERRQQGLRVLLKGSE